MTRIRVLLLAAVFALAAACGQAPQTQAPQTQAPQTQAPLAATDSATTATPSATADGPIAAPVATPIDADATVNAPPAAAPVEESASTDAAAPASNPLGKDIVLADSTPAKTDWQYQEGKHFNILTSAQGTSSSAGKIEVAEVFWYGCPHCYN
ncbi:MAG: hypothetical protein ABI661_09705, partial [Gammaproteobacteria bacterium]